MYKNRSIPRLETLESRQFFSGGPLPFGSSPYVAGQTIEAENFDRGGEGVAWHYPSHTAVKSTYRSDTTVGIGKAAGDDGVNHGASNSHYVTNTLVGEWLDYTITVPTSGNCVLKRRVADTVNYAKFHGSFDEHWRDPRRHQPTGIPSLQTSFI